MTEPSGHLIGGDGWFIAVPLDCGLDASEEDGIISILPASGDDVFQISQYFKESEILKEELLEFLAGILPDSVAEEWIRDPVTATVGDFSGYVVGVIENNAAYRYWVAAADQIMLFITQVVGIDETRSSDAFIDALLGSLRRADNWQVSQADQESTS